jgi:hypothetical protein
MRQTHIIFLVVYPTTSDISYPIYPIYHISHISYIPYIVYISPWHGWSYNPVSVGRRRWLQCSLAATNVRGRRPLLNGYLRNVGSTAEVWMIHERIPLQISHGVNMPLIRSEKVFHHSPFDPWQAILLVPPRPCRCCWGYVIRRS